MQNENKIAGARDFDTALKSFPDIGAQVGAFLLAEKMRVLLDAIKNAKCKYDTPDDLILMQIMRDVLKPYLPETTCEG